MKTRGLAISDKGGSASEQGSPRKNGGVQSPANRQAQCPHYVLLKAIQDMVTFGRQTLNGFLCHVSTIISMPGTSPVELSYTTSELSGVCLSPFPIWLGLGLH